MLRSQITHRVNRYSISNANKYRASRKTSQWKYYYWYVNFIKQEKRFWEDCNKRVFALKTTTTRIRGILLSNFYFFVIGLSLFKMKLLTVSSILASQAFLLQFCNSKAFLYYVKTPTIINTVSSFLGANLDFAIH
jgi:hypothetical protein